MQPLSWTGLSSVLLAMFSITVGYGIVLPILPLLIQRLANTADATILSRHTGLLTATYIISIFLFAPLWGALSDRWGRRPVILLGLTGFGITLTVFTLVESLPLLYLGRFLDGTFAAAITPVAYALVGDHAPSREWQARRFALISVAGTAGLFFGPMLGGLAVWAFRELFSNTADWTTSAPFFVTSGLAFVSAAAIWSLVRQSVRQAGNLTSKLEQRVERAVLLCLWIIGFVTALAIGAFEVGLSLRGKQIFGMDPARIGLMFAECSLIMFIVQVVVFSPLVKPERTRWLFAPGLAILAIGLIGVPFADDWIAMSVAVALVAASAGIVSPIVTYWASLGSGETHGADLGRVTAATSLGQAIGSAAGGLFFDISIVPGGSFTFAAAFVLAGFTVSINLPRRLVNDGDERRRG